MPRDETRFRPPPDEVPSLAIFIQRVGDGTHTGILFRQNKELYKQHLCWHESLESQACRRHPHFVVPVLEEEEINDVAGLCRLIHDRHNTVGELIPYALRYSSDTWFDATTGALRLGSGVGLTCSSFVVAVFATAKVELVDISSWQERPDDQRRHQQLLDWMRKGVGNFPPANPEHIAKVEAELPCIRVRPEEVAAAGLFADLPISFDVAQETGEWIVKTITTAH